jgi:hypothetical protein
MGPTSSTKLLLHVIILGGTWICASKTKGSCLILKPTYMLWYFQRLYCLTVMGTEFYPQSPWKHIVIPFLTLPPKLLSRWFYSFVMLFIDGPFGNKIWGCHGSAHIYIVLKCQNDKHCTDVPQDSNPACLWQFRMQVTKHISSGNRFSSMSSLTFFSCKSQGLRLIKTRTFYFWR